ncbi:MAG TPA: MBL fold metallo-hydrolase [Sediminibacterium sp.]|nr:MBL fold metallo-hydrolase [Sediminibacterium sp.]
MKIIPLSEGAFTVDASKVFMPFNTDSDTMSTRPNGSLLVEIQPFVIQTAAETILLDTGLGLQNKAGMLQLHSNLEAAGIAPATVTKVLLSHLHKDHSGGIAIPEPLSGQRFLSFPYANWYLQRREFDYAMNTQSPSFRQEDFALLESFSKTVWLEEDAGTIGPGIHYQLTGGHSRFHQVFRIEEEGEIAFFGGDVAPQLQQLRSRFIAKYDFDGRKAMELRQEWYRQGMAEKWTFLFYHDIKNPVWKAGD